MNCGGFGGLLLGIGLDGYGYGYEMDVLFWCDFFFFTDSARVWGRGQGRGGGNMGRGMEERHSSSVRTRAGGAMKGKECFRGMIYRTGIRTVLAFSRRLSSRKKETLFFTYQNENSSHLIQERFCFSNHKFFSPASIAKNSLPIIETNLQVNSSNKKPGLCHSPETQMKLIFGG